MVNEDYQDELELTADALDTIEKYAEIDSQVFGEDFRQPESEADELQRIYLVEDFNEVDDLFMRGAQGDCKCPAPLLLLLWQERKYLKKRLRQEGLWRNVNQ